MANPTRKGFRPVRSINGITTWDLSLAEPYLVDDAIFDDTEASALCVGHPVMATSTENTIAGELGHLRMVIPMTAQHVANETRNDDAATAEADLVAGVVVGISRIGEMTSFNGLNSSFHAGPDNLAASSKYVTSAEVEADPDGFLVWVAGANDWIFEGTIEAADQETANGMRLLIVCADDGTDEIVNTTTGAALVDLIQGDESQAIVTHVPRYIDNDPEAADARVWFRFNPSLSDPLNVGSDAGDATAS